MTTDHSVNAEAPRAAREPAISRATLPGTPFALRAGMRKPLSTIAVEVLVTSAAVSALACATPSALPGVNACQESLSVCLDVDSDCTFDRARQCMVCQCGKSQKRDAREGPHGPMH